MNLKICRIYYVIVVLFSTFKSNVSQGLGDCEIDELTEDDWLVGYVALIQDDFSDRASNEYKITFHLKKIKGVNIISKKYLDYNVSDDYRELNIIISKDMKNYEEIETDGTQTKILFEFQCETNTRNLEFIQPLYDVNNHPPIFTKKEYNFVIPIPWPRNVPLTLLQEIIVQDIDFSNREIKFDIEKNDFLAISYGEIDATKKKHTAILQPTNSIQISDDLILEIKATDQLDKYNNQHTEVTKIKIIPDIENSVIPEPKFEEIHYIGTYLEDDTIKISPIKLVKNTYSKDIQVTLIGEYQDHFKIKKVKDVYQIDVKIPIGADVWDERRYTYLYIIATDTKKSLVGKSVITIDFPKILLSTTNCPVITTTECPICPDCTTENTPTANSDVTCPDVTCPDITCPDITTTTSAADVTCPTCPDCTTECSLLTCPTTGSSTTTETAETTSPTSSTSSCPTVACPEITNTTPECPTMYTETTCLPCTESTTHCSTNEPEPDPIGLYFPEPSEVNIKITTDYSGEIVSKTAFVYPIESITYSVNTGSSLRNFIKINNKTGVVSVVQNDESQIIQDLYTVTVEANTKSKQKATYQIILLVEHVPVTPFALTYRTLNENENFKDFQTIDQKDKRQKCKFEILEVGPSGADKKWFSVNSEGNIDAGKILRDHPAFKRNNMKEQVQAQLVLQLNCQNQIQNFYDTFKNSSQVLRLETPKLNFDNFSKERNWIYTANIEQRDAVMVISIDIIPTINHPPVFDENSPLYIGYPSRELASYIQPPCVYQVHATDEDIGLDGVVSYYLKGTPIFLIHEKTGVIYPSKESAEWLTENTQINFTAMAIDRNGEGLEAKPLNILVKFLSQEEISVMKVDQAMQEDLNDIITELSKKTKWTVRQLAHAVVPEEKITKEDKKRSAFETFYRLFTTEDTTPQLTIYTYALGNNNEIIPAKEFSDKVKTVSIDDKPWNVQSVEPQPNTTHIIVVEKPSKENKGLLIAVIILGIAFGISILGSLWFFVKRSNEKGKEILLSTTRGDSSSTPSIYSIEDNNLIGRKKSNISIVLNDNLIGSTNDKDAVLDQSPPPASTDDNSTRERKKSFVTFNDNVQEIDIKL